MKQEVLDRIRALANKARTDSTMPAEEVVELFALIPQLCDHAEYLQTVMAEVLDPNYDERSLQ